MLLFLPVFVLKESDLTHAAKLFLFDGLRDADLFERIIGGDLAQVNLVPAAILDSRLIAANDGGLPMIVPSKAAQIDGVAVSLISEKQAARLAFYYAAFFWEGGRARKSLCMQCALSLCKLI